MIYKSHKKDGEFEFSDKIKPGMLASFYTNAGVLSGVVLNTYPDLISIRQHDGNIRSIDIDELIYDHCELWISDDLKSKPVRVQKIADLTGRCLHGFIVRDVNGHSVCNCPDCKI